MSNRMGNRGNLRAIETQMFVGQREYAPPDRGQKTEFLRIASHPRSARVSAASAPNATLDFNSDLAIAIGKIDPIAMRASGGIFWFEG